MTCPRILIAGIGNIFRGDDAFGVEVVRRLAGWPRPECVHVADFGIRGHDLAYAILNGYDAVILVDAVGHGRDPGTLSVLELDPTEPIPPAAAVGGHGIDLPVVFHLVRMMGGVFPRLCLVGCEPGALGLEDEGLMGLSEPVAAALDPAIGTVEALVADLLVETSRA